MSTISKFNDISCLVKYVCRPHEKAQRLSLGERNSDVNNREAEADYAAIGDAS